MKNSNLSDFRRDRLSEPRLVTYFDYARIMNGITKFTGNKKIEPGILHKMYLLLCFSKKILPEKVPDDVITLNTVFNLINDKIHSRARLTENVKNPGDISVYSIQGINLLGRREKTLIDYLDGDRTRTVLIERIIFQPERENIFNM